MVAAEDGFLTYHAHFTITHLLHSKLYIALVTDMSLLVRSRTLDATSHFAKPCSQILVLNWRGIQDSLQYFDPYGGYTAFNDKSLRFYVRATFPKFGYSSIASQQNYNVSLLAMPTASSV